MASFVEFFVRRYKIDVVLCVLYRFSYDLLFHVFLTDQNFRWVDWYWFIRKNLLCKPSIIKQLEIIYRAQQGMLENQFQVNPKMSRVESVKMNLPPGLDSSIHIYCNGPKTSLCKKNMKAVSVLSLMTITTATTLTMNTCTSKSRTPKLLRYSTAQYDLDT